MFAAICAAGVWIPGPRAEPAPLAGGAGNLEASIPAEYPGGTLRKALMEGSLQPFSYLYSQNAIFTQRQVFLANEERDPEFKKKDPYIHNSYFSSLYQELEGQSLLPKYKINVMILVG